MGDQQNVKGDLSAVEAARLDPLFGKLIDTDGHIYMPVDVLEDVGTVEPRAVVVTLAVDVGVGECVGVLVPTMYWMRLFPCV